MPVMAKVNLVYYHDGDANHGNFGDELSIRK